MLPTKCANLSDGSKRDVNVFLIGLTFFFTFTAFFTMSNIQTVVLDNATNENSSGYVEGFNGDGFVSLSIIYAVSCVFDLLAPSIVAAVGLKTTLVVASCAYPAFIATFYALEEWLLYLGSSVVGVGNALYWVSQGSFLSLNSTPDTIGRNAGIFYVMLKSSGLIGNTFSYFQFKDSYEIAPDTLTLFVSVLVVVSAMGTLTVMFVFPTRPKDDDAASVTPVESLVGATKLMLTREMRYLILYFTYTGLVFTFWSGVYGPCLSFSRSFGADGHSLTSLHGIAAHAGEISMGTFLAVFSGVAKRVGRHALVFFGLAAHLTSFSLISINVPADAPLGVTYDDAALIVPSNTGLALFCSYLLGVGVMCMESQTVSLVGVLYSGRTSQAFAVVKVFQHGAVGVAYAYSGYANLYVQLGILAAFGVLGACAFAKIELECFGRDFDVPRHRDSIAVDSYIKT